MRWPFGPPHLTLKPSNKKKNKTQKNKRKEKAKKEKLKTQKYQKKSFSVISQFFFFLGGGVQKFLFLTTWPRKRAPKKTQNRGFSKAFLEKQLCVTKRPLLDKKNTNPDFSYHFFPYFFSFTNRNTKNC